MPKVTQKPTRALTLLTVVGARPQFIKAAMVSRAVAQHNRSGSGAAVVEEIVHTGQHFDRQMSDIFFTEMGIPEPAANLDVNNAGHGEMTGRMLAALEREMLARRPDWVLVYGDTNSTLAAALAAAKLHIPVAHVEAGLRSFNKRMPEEVNRVLADHVSALLFCPTRAAVANLAREGIGDPGAGEAEGAAPATPDRPQVLHVGDVMYDAALVFGRIAAEKSRITESLGLGPKRFALVTCHRAENTDDPRRLGGIIGALKELSRALPVVFPVHPRTRKKLAGAASLRTADAPDLRLLEPVSFLDMVRLERDAKIVLTDSGGVQKEAYFHGVPCVTMRDETEWVETVDAGWNTLAGADPRRILQAAQDAKPGRTIEEYGTGQAAQKILTTLLQTQG